MILVYPTITTKAEPMLSFGLHAWTWTTDETGLAVTFTGEVVRLPFSINPTQRLGYSLNPTVSRGFSSNPTPRLPMGS